jgi:hypothetical protein
MTTPQEKACREAFIDEKAFEHAWDTLMLCDRVGKAALRQTIEAYECFRRHPNLDDPKVVEAAAKALFDDCKDHTRTLWRHASPKTQRKWEKRARSAIAAIKGAV